LENVPRSGWAAMLKLDPVLDPIREHPRFDSVMR